MSGFLVAWYASGWASCAILAIWFKELTLLGLLLAFVSGTIGQVILSLQFAADWLQRNGDPSLWKSDD